MKETVDGLHELRDVRVGGGGSGGWSGCALRVLELCMHASFWVGVRLELVSRQRRQPNGTPPQRRRVGNDELPHSIDRLKFLNFYLFVMQLDLPTQIESYSDFLSQFEFFKVTLSLLSCT